MRHRSETVERHITRPLHAQSPKPTETLGWKGVTLVPSQLKAMLLADSGLGKFCQRVSNNYSYFPKENLLRTPNTRYSIS